MSIELYDPEFILQILQSLENENEKYNGITFSARQYFFVDPMISYNNGKPGIGNKLAFELFIKKMKPGYYVSMDANNFKLINNTLSHIVGDLAIKSIGKALRDVTLKIDYCKLFRSGGDEFLFYCENHDSMKAFLELALEELDKIELVNNKYKLTLSFGIGISYKDAEDSLKEAKKKKINTINEHLVHSNIQTL
jgi:diguanylate cyclase (GGDEF)-like protein